MAQLLELLLFNLYHFFFVLLLFELFSDIELTYSEYFKLVLNVSLFTVMN